MYYPVTIVMAFEHEGKMKFVRWDTVVFVVDIVEKREQCCLAIQLTLLCCDVGLMFLVGANKKWFSVLIFAQLAAARLFTHDCEPM